MGGVSQIKLSKLNEKTEKQIKACLWGHAWFYMHGSKLSTCDWTTPAVTVATVTKSSGQLFASEPHLRISSNGRDDV